MKDRKKIHSVISLIIVLAVIGAAFLFRDEIERFALTGYLGVFIACLASTATILLPAPGILIVAEYATILIPWIVVLLGALGTSLGEMFGYWLGKSGNELAKINTKGKWFSLLQRKPMLWVFLFSMIPLPVFDIIGVCAGMSKINPLKFWAACFVGKLIKMAVFTAFSGYILNHIDLLN